MVIDYGKIIFGGVDSSDYGIYISGEGVYNAPERVVEFVEVPGRNGTIAMDQGRYENISVTYPAMYLGKNQEEFREKLSDFRNAILSQKGYQKLEDSYHPDEYRMGVYASGLEVTKLFRKMRGGEFELTFNCKPQRWLTVGELPIPVDSGDVLQNPTPFDAGPLLELEGYGDVSFNGFTISLDNAVLGNVELVPRTQEDTSEDSIEIEYPLDTSLFNDDDTITIQPVEFVFDYWSADTLYTGVSYNIDTSSSTVTPTVKVPAYTQSSGGNHLVTTVVFPEITQDAPSSGYYQPFVVAINLTATKSGGGTSTGRCVCAVNIYHDKVVVYMLGGWSSGVRAVQNYYRLPAVRVDSTVNILGHPTYIDCELGEAYRIVDGEYKTLNRYVALGSDLPALAPGSNKITFSDTFTDVKIVPGWWRI